MESFLRGRIYPFSTWGQLLVTKQSSLTCMYILMTLSMRMRRAGKWVLTRFPQEPSSKRTSPDHVSQCAIARIKYFGATLVFCSLQHQLLVVLRLLMIKRCLVYGVTDRRFWTARSGGINTDGSNPERIFKKIFYNYYNTRAWNWRRLK